MVISTIFLLSVYRKTQSRPGMFRLPRRICMPGCFRNLGYLGERAAQGYTSCRLYMCSSIVPDLILVVVLKDSSLQKEVVEVQC